MHEESTCYNKNLDGRRNNIPFYKEYILLLNEFLPENNQESEDSKSIETGMNAICKKHFL
jgi:hypothetical protein